MVKAFEESSVLEREALSITRHIPWHDEYGKARVIYDWMREHIDYDQVRLEQIEAGTLMEHYRNNIETYVDGRGVCGEQTLLYVSLARYAGLQADYVSNNEAPGHAVSRVYTSQRTIDVDTTKTGPSGFDAQGYYSHFIARSESYLDDMVSRQREDPPLPSPPYLEEPHSPEHSSCYRRQHRYHRNHHSAPFIRPDVTWWEVKAFIVAAILAVPFFRYMDARTEKYIAARKTVLVSDSARPYAEASINLAWRRYGRDWESKFAILKHRCDLDRNGILEENEAHAMYQHLKDGGNQE